MPDPNVRPAVNHLQDAPPQERDLTEMVAACVESFEASIWLDLKETLNKRYQQYRGFRRFKDDWIKAGPNDRDGLLRDTKQTWGAQLHIPLSYRTIETMVPRAIAHRPKLIYLPRKEIWEENGTITGFWGDELMAIFNAPLEQEKHAVRALRAAWKMRVAVQAYQQSQHQDYPISFGFGVNTGEAMVGNIGSRERLQNYTAIGDAVNVAARLQKNASDNNILLNNSTYERARQFVQVSMLPPLEVKNRAEKLDVFCLQGLMDE